MNRYAAALLLAISLTAPLAVADDHSGKRYYDKTHKDYHQWNDGEEHSYTTYRTEKHIPEHTFAHAKRSEQQNYWNWRHEHPDDKH